MALLSKMRDTIKKRDMELAARNSAYESLEKLHNATKTQLNSENESQRRLIESLNYQIGLLNRTAEEVQ